MTYLVTGGTGSFGHRFVARALRERDVKKIIVLSRDEFKLYRMKKEISDNRMRYFNGDVRDKERLLRIMPGVDVVIHAAAMKQIPACEESPFEAIKTNILGAYNVCEAALDCGVKKAIALSTDKAVGPVNLYGTTKLAMEKIFIGANVYAQGKNQAFSIVRYGNVAGSRGSVIPLFKEMVAPLPVTNAWMTRFWMTLDDAVDIVFKAIDTATGGEVFIPKMRAFKICELAAALGKTWKEVGNRGGEKLHESMWTETDVVHDMGTHYEISPVGTEWFRKNYPDESNFAYRSDTVPLISVAELEERLKTV